MSDQAEALRRLVGERRPTTKARVVAVTSGKGGVGKTNLAVNLAISLARLGLRTGVLDGDLGLANVDIVLGLNPEFNLGHVVYGQKRLDQILVEGPEGIAVFSGGTGVYELANLSQWLLQRFIREIGALDTKLDLLFLDTGAGISRNAMSFVFASEEVIVVTTPELTAIADAYGVIKLVLSKNPNTKVRVIVNMARDERQAEVVLRSLTRVTRQFLGYDACLELLGHVPIDACVSRAVQTQTPFVIAYPTSQASRRVEAIAHRLQSGGLDRQPSGIGGLFQRMADFLSRRGA